ncbi:hypothetical protein J7J47_03660 [Halomonas sp. ISL-60]|uniref:hypothetical protein n=1 Tax=Halomonas sp. ISL-56 TaxID=2819149 RepID=UPI001BE55DCB|nr:hypothetical protein [Halomonas sp. ISL-56]MBT2771326.1 hypothetical protein [Halomonas sp. ISL-60]MBT2800683.1 hypothetical protein [Halomonas sp. ISL-56]
MNKIITRAEAKAQGLKRYYTGKKCKRGHLSERRTQQADCIACRDILDKQYKIDKADKIKKYRIDNVEKIKIGKKKYRHRHAEKIKEYQKNNRAQFNLHRSNCELRERNLNKNWNDQMLRYYEESTQLTKETGIKHHVDHIVPINGENVSGLHVPWNLQVIPAFNNISKGNKLLETIIIYDK